MEGGILMLKKVFWVSVLLLVVFVQPAMAQGSADLKQVQDQLNQKLKELDAFDPLIAGEDFSEQELNASRQKIKDIRAEILQISDALKPLLDLTKAEIDDLGQAPTAPEGETPPEEPENIKSLRQSLQEKYNQLDGLSIQVEASLSKASRYLERLASLRRDRFVNKVLEKQISPFDPALWKVADDTKSLTLNAFSRTFKHLFLKDGVLRLSVLSSIIAFCLIFFSARFLSNRALHRRIADYTADKRESLFYHVSISIIVPVLAGVVGLAIIYQSIRSEGLIPEAFQQAAISIFLQINVFIFVSMLTRRLATARLLRRKIRWLYISAALIYIFDIILSTVGDAVKAPFEFSLAQSYIVTTIFAVQMMLFSLSILQKDRLRRIEESKKQNSNQDETPLQKDPNIVARFFLPKQLFQAFMATGVIILMMNASGYVALSHFTFVLFMKAFTFGAFLLMIRALVRPMLSQIDLWLYAHEKDTRKEEERFMLFWINLTFDLLLFSISLPVWAGIFGVAWEDIKDQVIHAFFGFQIGGITFSISNFGIAIIMFMVLLSGTRFFQKVLGNKILPKTKIESSVQQSLTQIIGYIGLIIAFMASVSALGFDLSNLALIAGALSVGIGFGLQSIVSNFVSGLILLFERPIKVGDWVIVDSGQGMVKKISVRATEIETFDRTSIIVPNSELISSSVKNWTYKDKIGRVIIPIGVSYDSDPKQVYDLLMECAQNHPAVVRYPEPAVIFSDFGDSALVFEMRVFLRNIRDIHSVSNDLRFDIWNKFKEHKIEIPFPQTDIHIRSGEGLKKVLKNAK